MEYLVKCSLVAALVLFAFAVPCAAEESCPVRGDLVHWIADYCMARLETDDEIAAADCIAAEPAAKNGGECAAKMRYKRGMCELARQRGAILLSPERCVADPSFIGSTVRRGGVGGGPGR